MSLIVSQANVLHTLVLAKRGIEVFKKIYLSLLFVYKNVSSQLLLQYHVCLLTVMLLTMIVMY